MGGEGSGQGEGRAGGGVAGTVGGVWGFPASGSEFTELPAQPDQNKEARDVPLIWPRLGLQPLPLSLSLSLPPSLVSLSVLCC